MRADLKRLKRETESGTAYQRVRGQWRRHRIQALKYRPAANAIISILFPLLLHRLP